MRPMSNKEEKKGRGIFKLMILTVILTELIFVGGITALVGGWGFVASGTITGIVNVIVLGLIYDDLNY